MLSKRIHNNAAKITLDRAKLASQFKQNEFDKLFIEPCVQKHLNGMQESVSSAIKQTIGARGIHYFACRIVFRWMNDNLESIEKDDQDDEEEDDDHAEKRPRKKTRIDHKE